MKRRQARENSILALYEASFNANSIEDIIDMSRESGEYAVDAYGQALLINFYAHSAEVDDAVSARLKDWTLARLPRVNAAILRMAVTEMMYSEEDMDSIVINEAVEIAKKYAGEDDYQFINGVLGSIARELHPTQPHELPEQMEQEKSLEAAVAPEHSSLAELQKSAEECEALPESSVPDGEIMEVVQASTQEE